MMLRNGVAEFFAPLHPAAMNIGGKKAIRVAAHVLALQCKGDHIQVPAVPGPQRAAADADLMEQGRQMLVGHALRAIQAGGAAQRKRLVPQRIAVRRDVHIRRGARRRGQGALAAARATDFKLRGALAMVVAAVVGAALPP